MSKGFIAITKWLSAYNNNNAILFFFFAHKRREIKRKRFCCWWFHFPRPIIIRAMKELYHFYSLCERIPFELDIKSRQTKIIKTNGNARKKKRYITISVCPRKKTINSWFLLFMHIQKWCDDVRLRHGNRWKRIWDAHHSLACALTKHLNIRSRKSQYGFWLILPLKEKYLFACIKNNVCCS